MRSKSSQNLVCNSIQIQRERVGFLSSSFFSNVWAFLYTHQKKWHCLFLFNFMFITSLSFCLGESKIPPNSDVIVTHRNASACMIFGRHSADLRKILQHLSREFVWVTAVQQMMLPLPRCRCSRLEIGGQPMLVATKNMTWDAYVWLISIIMLLSLVSQRIFFRRSAWFSVVKHCRVYVARDQREAVYH